VLSCGKASVNLTELQNGYIEASLAMKATWQDKGSWNSKQSCKLSQALLSSTAHASGHTHTCSSYLLPFVFLRNINMLWSAQC
jgi:hypothetical protein